jgi:hypothetical protein
MLLLTVTEDFYGDHVGGFEIKESIRSTSKIPCIFFQTLGRPSRFHPRFSRKRCLVEVAAFSFKLPVAFLSLSGVFAWLFEADGEG